jgi:hypothetical protein
MIDFASLFNQGIREIVMKNGKRYKYVQEDKDAWYWTVFEKEVS